MQTYYEARVRGCCVMKERDINPPAPLRDLDEIDPDKDYDYHKGECPMCEGRGHPLAKDEPCEDCGGTGWLDE